MDDLAHMRAALALARRGMGNCWPNPEVGCVLVKDGRVIGRAVTAPGGRPHAETLALRMAGEAARGATAYVTLEPCCHVGKTGPCAEALIAAGVARVVIGATDPDPRVNGGGIARLRAAGIAVEQGLLQAEAEAVAAGFFSRVRLGRPLVTLKLASTLDGRIATSAGESRWITGETARHVAHALRGSHDAVMVGVGTMLADDPDLTCRLAGYKQVPMVRVVLDSDLRTPVTARVIATARQDPTWLLTRHQVDPQRKRTFAESGTDVIQVPDSSPAVGGEEEQRAVSLPGGLRALGSRGINRLLVEGGSRLAASLLAADLVDRIAWFHAPAVMGGDGLPAAQGFGSGRLAAMPRFVRTRVAPVGEDVLTELARAA